ncbi:MAG: response regulator [Salibacter sp.]|uniref:response regulator transcription factor n=1 Tax=Salibacter sp. TaxID=2010995 RepID=UPI0028703BD1|nr:response regulator [Salibacter sp.]MDR9398311.1 response regulator [Salibacter sp.]
MSNSPKKVLVVDDEPNIIMSLDFLIKKAGYDLFIARNGTEALTIIEDERPDLIVLDIMMPDIDGFEVCRRVKSSEELKDIHVIFLSAKSRQGDIKKGLEIGADNYITKPFSTKELLKEIKTILS